MKDWTGTEIEEALQQLEQASALALGRMLFEFARLDAALGLFLVWSGGGQNVQQRTPEIESLTFHNKLNSLARLCANKLVEGEPSYILYNQWLKDAHSIRLVRNSLFHGRWGIEPIKDRVINVTGLPTSNGQIVREYAVRDLKRILGQMQRLQYRLSVLRSDYPL